MGKKKTHQEFVEQVFGLVGNTYEVLGEYKNARTRISMKHVICGHEFEMRPKNFLSGQRCPSCFGKFKKTTEEFKDEVKQIVGDTYRVLGEYMHSKTNILMKHNECGHEFEMIPNNFLQGNRCPQCFGKNKKTTEQFKSEVKSLVGNFYEVLGEYKNDATKIKMKHNNTSCSNHEFEMSPNSFLSGTRCPLCAGNMKKTIEQFKIEIKQITENKYEVAGEYKNDATKISMKHVICGHEFEMRPNDFLKGQRCPQCASSKGEQEITNILDKLNITYKPQYTFNDCRNKNPLPFDFAIIDKNNNLIALIEYQGRQHYEPIEFWGGEKNLTYVKNNDLIKKKYCIKNNIKLIEIPYWEFDNIEEILKDEIINSNRNQ